MIGDEAIPRATYERCSRRARALMNNDGPGSIHLGIHFGAAVQSVARN